MTMCETRGRRAGSGWRTCVAAAMALPVWTLAGCDVPTSLPRVESRFVIPGESGAVHVSELLPPTVTVMGGHFRLQVNTAQLPGRSLGELCGGTCEAFDGQQVPKPAFTDSMAALLHMPADVGEAVVSSGVLTVRLTHDFGFDPIRPTGALSQGAMTLTVRSGDRVAGSAVVTDPFPSGSTVERHIELEPGTVSSGLAVTVALASPASAVPVTIRSDARLTGSAVPGPIDVSEAHVVVVERPIQVDAVSMDLTGIDGVVAERVKSGALVLRVDNPFDVMSAGPLELHVRAEDMEIVKPVEMQPGASTQRVEFTREQIRSMLGRSLRVSLDGRVAGTNGVVRVQPDDAVRVQTTLDVVLELGRSR